MKTIFLLILITLMSISTKADTLKPFLSDGCSAFPDGTFKQNELWLACCYKHDFSYWKGGTRQERIDADKALEICVAETGEPEIAFIMLAGVTVGGTAFLPTKFRWGYGWSYPRYYGSLDESELLQVRIQTKKLKVNP